MTDIVMKKELRFITILEIIESRHQVLDHILNEKG